MPSAPRPVDETERLAALRAYDVLDTAPERQYDDLVQLASMICGTPVAAITLVDESRQWFKARVGVDVTETPREVAFCAFTIHQSVPLVVQDTLRDVRFADNPLVTGGPHFRFYAGAPLLTPSGHRLGSLCVLDSVPSQLSIEQIGALEALARLVVAQLEDRRIAGRLAEALREVEVLSGLLPICAYCKRIRDERNAWHPVEEYVAARTEASFTHGICPTCTIQHFPGAHQD